MSRLAAIPVPQNRTKRFDLSPELDAASRSVGELVAIRFKQEDIEPWEQFVGEFTNVSPVGERINSNYGMLLMCLDKVSYTVKT